MSETTWKNKEELLELLHENLLNDSEINSIIQNKNIVEYLKQRLDYFKRFSKDGRFSYDTRNKAYYCYNELKSIIDITQESKSDP